MPKIITVSHATKKFKSVTVLDDVTIEFEQGLIHGIIGRNGSGKTMLLKAICGFVPLTLGEIRVEEKLIGKDIDFPNNVGIIIETPGFLSHYSGLRNLKLLSNIRNKIDDKQITASMNLVGLDANNRKWVSKYSLGMRQRLGIAQVIMENPGIMILDEPMNGLDNDGVASIRAMLLRLKEQGKTIIIASHSREDIEVLCDTVCEMDKGKVMREGIEKCPLMPIS